MVLNLKLLYLTLVSLETNLEVGGERDAARIKIGKLLDHEDDDGNAKFGIMGFTGNSGSAGVDTIFKLGEDGNEIAGWTMTTSSISNGQVELSSALTRFDN